MTDHPPTYIGVELQRHFSLVSRTFLRRSEDLVAAERADGGAVVVGVDGSPGAQSAVRWAAAEARRRGAPLRVVAAAGSDWTSETPGAMRTLRASVLEHRQAWTEDTVAAAAQLARDTAANVPVDTQVYLRESAAEALLREGQTAQQLVIGGRGVGGSLLARIGSTAIAVTQQATCPVVVVRDSVAVAEEMSRRVVVGVDGSAASARAVEYAVTAAALRDVGVTAVRAWTVPRIPRMAEYLSLFGGTDWAPLQSQEEDELASSLAEIRRSHPEVEVTERVLEAKPAEALLSAAAEAQLLVVGSRGRGELSGLVLGSVSHAVISQASCPVAVVRP